VTTLLADNTKYAEHWMSFWNDLLRNDDGLSYFSDADGGGRQSITPYMLPRYELARLGDEYMNGVVHVENCRDRLMRLAGVTDVRHESWRREPAIACLLPCSIARYMSLKLFASAKSSLVNCKMSVIN
jgi:hypothetical protein